MPSTSGATTPHSAVRRGLLERGEGKARPLRGRRVVEADDREVSRDPQGEFVAGDFHGGGGHEVVRAEDRIGPVLAGEEPALPRLSLSRQRSTEEGLRRRGA